MQDFTLTTYKKLLQELLTSGYSFQTFEEYIKNPKKKVVILRHDVDRLPWNALVIAKIEKEAGIRGSYYFRIVKESYDEDTIRQIVEMGHEIGYHYENLSDPQITPVRFSEPTGQAQINADYLISHRPTPVPSSGATGQARTDTDIYPADPSTISRSYGAGFAGQKESLLREGTEVRDQMSEVRRARARNRDPQITPVRFSGPTGQGLTQMKGKRSLEINYFHKIMTFSYT